MKIFSFKRLSLPGLLCLLLCGLISSASAQDARLQVTGTVRNDAGELLPNVSVVATNSKTKYTAGVQTDSTGVFRFSGLPPAGTYDFQISYTGFKEQTLKGFDLKEGITLTLAVKLVKSVTTFDDLVVIGYGNAPRRNVVGALDVVRSKEAGSTTATNPSQLLIGKSAGVQIVQSSGAAGADAQIIIRGTGSFTSVNPLYVIDGIQGSKNLFNTISTQDIENITILKDASMTAIYGAAAANGVVIITTKRGKNGIPRLSLNTQWGVSKPWKQLDLLNATQYVDAMKDLAVTKGSVLPPKFSTPGVLVDSTDWQSEVFRSALVSEHNINLSGGGDKFNYSVSATYINQQATLIDASNKRIQARLALEESIGRFKFNQSLSFRQINSYGAYANIISAIQYAPNKRILDASIPGGYSIMVSGTDYSSADNPLQSIALRNQYSKGITLFPQLSAEVKLITGLKFRSQFSAEINSSRANTYQQFYISSNNLNNARQATLEFTETSNYLIENYLTYDRTFNKHQIMATAGNTYINPGFNNQLVARGTGQPNDNIENIVVASSQAVSGSYNNYGIPAGISYFGRLNYNYDGKYLITSSARRDGGSNFGENFRNGTFYALGVAWRFSEESFVKDAFKFLSDGKLRAGWGQTGNNNIPNFQNTSKTYQGYPAGNLVYSFGSTETFVSGTTLTTVSNPDLQWELTGQTDIGLDLSFLDNRLTVNADWYNRKSDKLLVTISLPASIGISATGAQPTKIVNAANAQNTGFELALGYRDRISKNVNFNVSINGSVNKNKVNSLGEAFQAPIRQGAFDQSVPATTYTAAGSAIGSFYGYRLSHVARDAAEITALNAAAAAKTGNAAIKYQDNLLPGDFVYKDLNGDGIVNALDQEILGNPIPKFVFGLNAGVNAGNFDLNFVISGISGVKLLNGVKLNTQMMSTAHNASTAILDRWRAPGDVAALPRIGQSTTGNGNLRPSDWWLEDGSYLRMRNITIGYTIPSQKLSTIINGSFKTIRLYVAAQNLFTITNYTGYDPEVGGSNFVFARGIDVGQVPQSRTFLAGLQLGF